MPGNKVIATTHVDPVRTTDELGKLIRGVRKSQHLTLEKVSGISNLSMRFLSELERGKETAELGKVLKTLSQLGLEVIVQPRGTQQHLIRQLARAHSQDNNDEE